MEFALLQVGINEYPLVPLQGCVNDCLNLSRQFTRFGLTTSKVVRLLDRNATRANIIESLRWLIRQDVDLLIFQYSGHGTRIRDRSYDESSGYDSAICPVYSLDGEVILDDELADIYALVAPGKRLIVFSDSCHSGKSQRSLRLTLKKWKTKLLRSDTPRFLPPNLIPGQMSLEDSETDLVRARDYFTRRKSFLENSERCVLISTCREDQTSADAWINNNWQGAGTAGLIWGWNRAGVRASYGTVAQYANGWLKENGYDQVLRVEGKAEVKDRPIFT
jgi:metacaspase-1